MMKEWSQQFQLAESFYAEVKSPVSRQQSQQIAAAIKKKNAELGLVVRDQFGWIWFPLGTGIANYLFKTCTTVFNQQGKMVWGFCGKGAILSPELIKTAYPDPVSITQYYEPFFTHYPKFLLLLLKEDQAGKVHGSEFLEYFHLDSKNLPVSVYNAEDAGFWPSFTDTGF
jgi:hypothetical protein